MTSQFLNTEALALEALRTGNKFADNQRYMSAQMFFKLSDRLQKLSRSISEVSPVRLYCEGILSGMPEPRADLFATLCGMDERLAYPLPRAIRINIEEPGARA